MFIYLASIKLHYDEQRPIKKNYHLTTLDYIGKEYKISFDFCVTYFGKELYESVIHFTQGGNNGKYGDRTPAVWVTNKKKVHIASAISGNRDSADSICCIEAGKWYKIEISQYKYKLDEKVKN